MLDIKLLREEPEKVKKGVAAKGDDPKLVDEFLRLDEIWRKLTAEIENLRHEQKELEGERDFEAAKAVKEKIKEKEKELGMTETERRNAWMSIPNIPFEDIPAGKSEEDNRILREVGEKPEFDFVPKDHAELGKSLGIIDFESGSKIAGSGFYFLKNEGVLLELALVRYALDFLTENGFVLWLTPDLARDTFYLSTGYHPRGPEAQTYTIEGSDLGLIATAEVTLAGIHSDEMLEESALPKLYAGYSHCFRQEGGAYGKYSKGLYRVHQFTKVEMFVYCKAGDSPELHQKLLWLEEKLWQGLGIPYRVLEMCAGDLGAQAARKFDLEAWMPGRGDWGEVTSTSNTSDYQARRLGIRFRGKDGNVEFAHTLNGTAVATSRAIVAILENYQTKEGKVAIPSVLQKYVGKEIIG
ncbi:MAG: serine--tRNA ligase [Candidatus Liptonbacteria bacterium]|nr:serine--tRNA ligase [Candidatus Liptonbacteria bacterium]